MTKEELKQNIGTIAFSGSKKFVQKLQEGFLYLIFQKEKQKMQFQILLGNLGVF
jgi:HSP90 family molecular chaperone